MSRNRTIVRFNRETGERESSAPTSSSSKSSKKLKPSSNSDDELSEEQMNRLICDAVKYLLIMDAKKVVIKRADMFKAVLKNACSNATKDKIMREINAELTKSFGLQLHDCPNNSYILVNKLKSVNGVNELVSEDSIPDSEHFCSALLTSILATILMSEQSVHEEVLYRFVAKLGFDIESKQTINVNNDSTGVTLKKLLTDVWVKQQYLKYEKILRSDPPSHEFSWGLRAFCEFSQMDVLKFVCKIFGEDMKPEYWRNQYQKALNSQVNNEENGEENSDNSSDDD